MESKGAIKKVKIRQFKESWLEEGD